MFQRLSEIRGEVQRAVKRDGQPRRCVDQLAHRCDVYSAVTIENADHDAGGAGLTGDVDVSLHYVDFIRGINEVATTRSNQHEYGNPYALDYCGD
jgi:hypothetical protein